MYCFARSIWRKRNEATPSGKQTWGQRFTEMFGVDFDEYTDGLMAQGRADKEHG